MKKFLAMTLVLIMVLSCLPVSAFADGEDHAVGDTVEGVNMPEGTIPEGSKWVQSFEKRLICGKEESSEHKHSDECYKEVSIWTLTKDEPAASGTLKVSLVLDGDMTDAQKSAAKNTLSIKLPDSSIKTVVITGTEPVTVSGLPVGTVELSVQSEAIENTFFAEPAAEPVSVEIKAGEESSQELTIKYVKKQNFSIILDFDAESTVNAGYIADNGLEIGYSIFGSTNGVNISGKLARDGEKFTGSHVLPYGEYKLSIALPHVDYNGHNMLNDIPVTVSADSTKSTNTAKYELGKGTLSIKNEVVYYDLDKKEAISKPNTGFETNSFKYTVTAPELSLNENIELAPGKNKDYSGLDYTKGGSVTLNTDGANFNFSAQKQDFTIGSNDKLNEGGDKALTNLSFRNTFYYRFAAKSFSSLVQNSDAKTGTGLKGGVFTVYSDAELNNKISTATGGDTGSVGLVFPDFGKYYIKQTKAPAGYDVNGTVFTVTVSPSYSVVTEDSDSGKIKVIKQSSTITLEGLNRNDSGQYVLTNEKSKPVTISVTKRFINDDKLKRPESVQVVLYRDGTEIERVTLSKDNNWKHSWKDLPGGYTYTVDELNVGAGYYKTIKNDGKNNFTITNSGSPSPVTGDGSALGLWAAMAVISAVGGAALLAVLRKRSRQN